ncbi:MAG TPA: YtxH domain-containing protein [Anaerolineales bacterium]|nr:YtxH domain-containing protein [Anaerolineales bacterium]
MTNQERIPQNTNGTSGSVLAGLLIGAAAGATAALLLAPQSGSATRQQIKAKGLELRDRTTGVLNETVSQVRSNAEALVSEGRTKAGKLKQQGQALLAEQLDRVAAAAQAGKKAVQNN